MNMKSNQHQFQHDLLGKKIAQQLDCSLQDMPHDLYERLKVARLRAVQSKKLVHPTQFQTGWSGSRLYGVLQWGGAGSDGFRKWAIALSLVLLILGLFTVANMQEDHFTQEVAAIDTLMLTDTVPPTAYTDPGFVMFLRMHADD